MVCLVDGFVDRLVARTLAAARFPVQPMHCAETGGHQPVSIHHLIRKPVLFGLTRIHFLPGEHVRERLLNSDEAGETLRAAHTRKKSELHLGQADRCGFVVGDDAIMAGECEFCAPAHAGTVDANHHRLGRFGDLIHHAMAGKTQRFQFGSGRSCLKKVNIRAGDERVLFPT